MGTNKRHAGTNAIRMGEYIDQVIMRDAEPVSLSDEELELDVQPLTRPPKAIKIKAWVRYGTIALMVDAEAVAWTAHAVAIRWEAPGGQHRAWVWASATRHRT